MLLLYLRLSLSVCDSASQDHSITHVFITYFVNMFVCLFVVVFFLKENFHAQRIGERFCKTKGKEKYI